MALSILLLVQHPALAQDDGPRVYQLAPVGAQNLTVFAVAKRGNEGPDPGQMFAGSTTATDIVVFRYARTFDLAGRQFTPFAILPSGRVRNASAGAAPISSSGLGDAQIGASLGLLGAPALGAEDYAEYRPGLSASVLGRVYFPTGAYDRDQATNLGANRFAFQLGLPTTFMFGQSYRDPHLTALEMLPTVTFYGANDRPFVGDKRTQDPLFSLETHLTHTFAARTWASADLLFRDGGASHTDGVSNNDPIRGWSAGASAAVPFTKRANLILTYEHVVQRWDNGPNGWFFRTALVVPF
jgi:hypothetical protein